MGRTLAHLWHKTGVFAVHDVCTRSTASAHTAVQFIGTGRAVTRIDDMRAADVWMLAVPDTHIHAVAQELAKYIQKQAVDCVLIAKSAIIFHCSGALAAAEMQALHDAGSHTASAHCLLSFSAPETAVQQFAGTLCALEGDAKATLELKKAFEHIGGQCFDLAAKDKILYHAAAVFATNFVPVLQHIASDLWLKTGVPAHMIETLSNTLLQNAVNNIQTQGAAQALTGPAARGDMALVALQGKAVTTWNAQAGQAYAALSQLASHMASHLAQKTTESTDNKVKQKK